MHTHIQFLVLFDFLKNGGLITLHQNLECSKIRHIQ